MIQYVPIEHGFAEGRDLYFVHCIWVHGYKGKGVGDQRKKGLGKALLAAAEEDARALGAKGMAAWGVSLPVFMRASWFKKHGYKKVDKNAVVGSALEAVHPGRRRAEMDPGKEKTGA